MGALSVATPPPDSATPAQNAAYWATLSKAEHDHLAATRPELVGPRDGFSAEQRDKANRILLDRERTGLQHQRDDLQRQIDHFPHTQARPSSRLATLTPPPMSPRTFPEPFLGLMASALTLTDGTTVVGHTARDLGLAADNIVFVASPGAGVENTQQLHLDDVPQNQVGSHIYATSAVTDPIPAATNVHHPAGDSIDPLGPDPTDGRFGAHVFESNPTNPMTSHSDYWNENSKSLKGMGEIIAGKNPK